MAAKVVKEVKDAIIKMEHDAVVNVIEDKAVQIAKIAMVNSTAGIHTVFHELGNTTFIDGVAEVEAKVAELLKKLGIIN